MRLTLVVSGLFFLGFTLVELRGRSRAPQDVPAPAATAPIGDACGPAPTELPLPEPIRPVAPEEPALSAHGPAVQVIDCAAGEVVFRPRGAAGELRSIPLRRTAGVPIAQSPELRQAERRFAEGDAAAAAPVYRRTAELAESGRAPAWAGALARARLMDMWFERGDFVRAADHWLALAALRPHGAEGFLPETLNCPEPEQHDAVVRKLHRELFDALSLGRNPRPALAMLERMRYTPPNRTPNQPPSGRLHELGDLRR